MKKNFIFTLFLPLILSSCSGASISNDSNHSSIIESDTNSDTSSVNIDDSTTSSQSDEYGTIDSIQEMNILHAWNWKLSNVSALLNDIKDAGYGAIQLSPLQPQKDYYNGQSWSSQWWKLYQPLGFSVATNNQNVLGTKSELTSLCKKAKDLDIKIIVDVVSNHLAGGNKTSLNSSVSNFENEIYSKKLIHTYGDYAKDNNLQSIVQGNIGDYPDLQTESSIVQNRVISLLKEYIDCGVDGFRFDAAKHIETPDDGAYASSYWPNVLTATTNYAISKGKDSPYYYGEILNTVGTNRSYSSYTKYMSTIDNKQGSKILNAVVNKNLNNLNATYNSNVSADKLVLWAESHDTYANDEKETTNISTENILKAYMIQASRKDTATLFYARPGSSIMGDVGTYDWKNSEIKAINEFSNIFVDKSENLSTNNGCFINVRGNSGAAIINISNTNNSVNLSISNLNDGTYIDLISKKEFVVSDEKANITFTNNACILVAKSNLNEKPTLSITCDNVVFQTTTKIKVNSSNADILSYSINGGENIEFTGNEISLPSNLSNGKILLKVNAKNNIGSISSTLTLIKTSSLINKDLIIYDVNITNYSLLAWVWNTSSDSSWQDFTFEGNIIGLNMNSKKNFIVVVFPNGTTSKNANWDNKIKQTEDIVFSKKLYSYEELGL